MQNTASPLSSNFLVRFFLPLAGILLFSPFSRVVSAQTAQVWDFSTAKPDPKNRDFAAPYTAPGGVPTSVAIEPRNGALRFSNRAGGSFGLKFNVPPFDATQFPTLDLSYTRSPDTKVNLFFKVNGSYYGVIFSGPPRVRPGSFLLGTIPNVGAKGRVLLPLRDWLRRFQPKAEKLQVEEILAGNWDNEGYLLAGIGGNGPGAAWSLTRFALLPAKSAPPQLSTPLFEGNRLVWPLQSGVLDTNTAVLGIGDQKFGFDSPFLHLEATLSPQNTLSERIIFEAGDAGLAWNDGQKLHLTISGASETLGWRLGTHASPVPLPRLQWENLTPPSFDFETDTQDIEPLNAVALLDGQRPASGQNSLQLYNPRTASNFDARFKIAAFDAAQFPILTFAYRNDNRLRLDFRLRWNGGEYFVRFTDRDGAQTKLGEIEDIPDEKWHYAVMPLLDWMKRAHPDATTFMVENLGVSDDGWKGNARGVTWNIDDLRAAPTFSGALKAKASLRDVSGVRAVSYQIDQNPQAEVDSTPEGNADLDIPLAGRAAGLYYLHLRAQNGAGTWSPAAHFSFIVK